jgi:hypothetical protein
MPCNTVAMFALVEATLLKGCGRHLQPLLLLPAVQQLGPDHVHCLMDRALCQFNSHASAAGAVQAVQAAVAVMCVAQRTCYVCYSSCARIS